PWRLPRSSLHSIAHRQGQTRRLHGVGYAALTGSLPSLWSARRRLHGVGYAALTGSLPSLWSARRRLHGVAYASLTGSLPSLWSDRRRLHGVGYPALTGSLPSLRFRLASATPPFAALGLAGLRFASPPPTRGPADENIPTPSDLLSPQPDSSG